MIGGMTGQRFNDIRTPFLILALIVQASLLLRLDWMTSPNRTELGHIAAALRFYETGEYDLFHVNPPLTRMLVGPAVAQFAAPQTDWSDYSNDRVKRSEWATGVALVKANDADTIRKSFFFGRAVCIPLVLLGSVFGFLLARELFGDFSGFVFLIFWTFSPLILGWGATICPDVAAASLGLVALYALRRWLLGSTWLQAVLAGLGLGLLPLVKTTWIIAFGIWPLLWLILSAFDGFHWKSCVQMTVIVGFGLLTLNAGYFFDGSFRPLRDYQFHSRSLTGLPHSTFKNVPVPFPKEFVQGIDTQRIDFEQGLPSYLLGKHSDHGWWYYYLIALPLKEPLAFSLLSVVALVLFGFVPFRASWRDELILLLPLVAMFAFVSMQSGFSLHTRYILPALPLIYLWISRIGKIFTSEVTERSMKRLTRLSVASVLSILLTTYTVSSLFCFPYMMSYTNELTRFCEKPPLLGSNMDWGQDLYELKDWLDEHPEARPLHIAFSGIFPLETLGIASVGQPPHWKPGQMPTGLWDEQLRIGPRPGWYLLGTNDLYAADHDYDWFHPLQPVKRIGDSIFIYNVSLDDANRLRDQDNLPKLNENEL